MTTQTANKRSSKHVLHTIAAALLLALLASFVPIGASDASALPTVSEAHQKDGVELTPNICFLLLLDLGGKHGKLSTLAPEIGVDIPGPESRDGDDTSINPDEPHPSDGVVDAYRDLDCASIPGFPDL